MNVIAKCRFCGKPAAYHVDHARMHLCEDCFIRYYEKKVYKTLTKHKMLRGARKVAAAISGGKDSIALLDVLHNIASKHFPDLEITAIHIDLGIPGYSEECRSISESVCEKLGIECLVYDLRKEEGYSIPDFEATPFKRRICGACGTVKRYLMNKIAYHIGADRLATGHNLDDVVEVLFELYLKGSVEEIVRMKPVSWSSHPKLVAKIKPLIELTEKENMYYVLAKKLPILSSQCPLAKESRMLRRKKLINIIEREIPGYRHTLYKSHLKRLLPKLENQVKEPEIRECIKCGMPTIGKTCSYCKLTTKLKQKLLKRATQGK